jgi:hypothetical protein
MDECTKEVLRLVVQLSIVAEGRSLLPGLLLMA